MSAKAITSIGRSGNPHGRPAVVLHGGPGPGSSPGTRRFFDPDAYRIIQFDQRQCGRSTPSAGDPDTDRSTNTTAHLLRDMDRLRRHLGIDHWLPLGTSWGSTLALAYAEASPAQVTAIVLVGVTMTRRSDIDWLYRGVAPLFPAEWQRFRAGAPPQLPDGDLVAAYYRLLNDPDPAVRAKAAADWHNWKAASISIDPDAKPPPNWSDPHYRMTRARIVTHYFRHNAWLAEGILLKNASALAGIPGVMVQGHLDPMRPLGAAWELDGAWSDGRLVVVPNARHSAGDPGMTEAILAATDRFAG